MTAEPAAVVSYLSRLRLAGMRPKTVQARRCILLAFAGTLAGRPLLEATRLDVEAFVGRDLAPNSRRTYLAALRSFYRWALEEEHVAQDPTVRVPNVRVPRARPRPVGSDDLDRALALADRRMRAWLLLMALAGLRCIEVAGLRPVDVTDHGTGVLLFLRECKGGGTATVPAHPAVLEALAALPIRDGLWWTVGPKTVSRDVGAHLRASGSRASAHQLRHFAGTSWYRASGHDLLATAALLRHASVATTMVYAKLDPERSSEVVNAVPLRLVSG